MKKQMTRYLCALMAAVLVFTSVDLTAYAGSVAASKSMEADAVSAELLRPEGENRTSEAASAKEEKNAAEEKTAVESRPEEEREKTAEESRSEEEREKTAAEESLTENSEKNAADEADRTESAGDASDADGETAMPGAFEEMPNPEEELSEIDEETGELPRTDVSLEGILSREEAELANLPVELPAGQEKGQSIAGELDDSDEMLQAYFEQCLMDGNSGISLLSLGLHEKALEDNPLCHAMYLAYKAQAERIAAGEASDSQVWVDVKDAFEKEYWSGADLGMEPIDSSNATQAVNRLIQRIKDDYYPNALVLFRAIRDDCPYEFFWSGLRISYGYSASSIEWKVENGEYFFKPKDFRYYFRLTVNDDYCLDGDIYSINMDKVRSIHSSVDNAKEIVAEAAAMSDWDKLDHYWSRLCALNSYNYEAADSDDYYGDPWQIIYLFDKDPATNVVCEGYAKSFAYLCELTEFNNPEIYTYITSGIMSYSGGGGGHMWNIIHMDDGKNYMVDITNCDSDYRPHKRLFIAPAASGSVADGYIVDGSRYTYYEETKQVLSEEELTLSLTPYVPSEAIQGGGCKLTFDVNGGSGSISPKSIRDGYAYGTLPTAVRDGYTFIGWYTSKTGGEQVTEKNVHHGDEGLTVYAGWLSAETDSTLGTPLGVSVEEDRDDGCNIIRWSADSTGRADGYEVSGWKSSGSYQVLGYTSGTVFRDYDPAFFTRYRVRSFSYSSDGSYIRLARFDNNIKAQENLEAPASLNHQQYGNTKMELSWSAVTGADGYEVHYKNANSFSEVKIGSVGADHLRFADVNLKSRNKGAYRVYAFQETTDGKGNAYTKMSEPASTEDSSWQAKSIEYFGEITVADCVYTGEPCEPAVTVHYAFSGSYDEVPATNYSVTYSSNVEVGTATVTVNADNKPGIYYGERTATFKIYRPVDMIYDASAEAFLISSEEQLRMFGRIITGDARKGEHYYVKMPGGAAFAGAISKTAKLTTDISLGSEELYLSRVEDAALDLGGHILSASSGKILNLGEANLTIRGGTIRNTSSAALTLYGIVGSVGNLTLQDVNLEFTGSSYEGLSTLLRWGSGSVTLDGCTLISSRATGIDSTGGGLTILDSQIKSKYIAISKYGGETRVTDSTVNSLEGMAIYATHRYADVPVFVDHSQILGYSNSLTASSSSLQPAVRTSDALTITNGSEIIGANLGAANYGNAAISDSHLKARTALVNSRESVSIGFLFGGTKTNTVQIRDSIFEAGKTGGAEPYGIISCADASAGLVENLNTKPLADFLVSGQCFSRPTVNNDTRVRSITYVDDGTSLHAAVISYELNGGTNSPENPASYQEGDFGGTITFMDPARAGYDFVGWYEEDTKIQTISTAEEENHTLEARWRAKTYQVSFDTAGGLALSPIRVTYDAPYGNLPTPQMAGADFLGWYTSGEEKIEEDTICRITGDLTLHASWSYRYTTQKPTANVGSGELDAGTGISLSCATNGAQIYYCMTTDGEEPGLPDAENGILFLDTIDTRGLTSLKLRAIAVKAGYQPSEIAEYEYTFIDDSAGWKDVSEQLQEQLEEMGIDEPEKVPDELWITGTFDSADYIGKAITFPDLKVFWGRRLLAPNTDYTVKYTGNTQAGTAKATITGKGNFAGTVVKEFTIRKRNLESAILDEPVLVTRGNGKVQKPVGTIRYILDGKSVVLKNGTDYKLDYPGTDSKKKAEYDKNAFKANGIYTVTATGTGNYEGTRTFRVEITPSGVMKQMSYTIKDASFLGGEPVYPALTVKDGKKVLKGYRIGNEIWENPEDPEAALNPENAEDLEALTGLFTENEELTAAYDYAYFCTNNRETGTASITFLGDGADYLGSYTRTFRVTGKSIAKVSVKNLPASFNRSDWNGSAIMPLDFETGAAYLMDGTRKLSGLPADEYDPERPGDFREYDYIYSYQNNCNAGTASILISGINGYTGTLKKTFAIKGIDMKNVSIGGIAKSYTFTGKPITPGYDSEAERFAETFKVYFAATKSKAEQVLVPCTDGETGDYTVQYQNNTKAGTGTMIITGINNYTGTVKKTFSIKPCALGDARISVDPIGELTYEKGGAVCVPVVRDSESEVPLTVNRDYTVKLTNHTAANNGSNSKKLPTVTITGKGNYSGSVKKTFTIAAADLDRTEMTAGNVIWQNKAGICKPVITLKDVNGKTLAAGTDYSKNVEYFYIEDTLITRIENKKAKAYVIRVPEGETVAVKAADIIPVGTILEARVTGTNNYFGTKSARFRYETADLSKATVTVNAQNYSGKAIEPSKNEIGVVVNKKTLTAEDYEILEYRNNVKAGTATLVLQGIGNYGGTKTATFKIAPKSMNYSITYDANNTYMLEEKSYAPNASGTMKNSSVTAGAKLTANTYKRNGYAFAGWNAKPDGSGAAYANQEAFRQKTAVEGLGTYGDRITLYAQWNPVANKITYKDAVVGKNGVTANPNGASYSIETGIILADPTRTGYIFDGWYLDSKLKNRVTGFAIGTYGAKTLYAKWKKL